jgi:hypothetical protein
MTRHDEAAPAQVGAADSLHIRGNIVAHPCEYVRP